MARAAVKVLTNEDRVTSYLAVLRKRGELDELFETLGTLALTLARRLDAGDVDDKAIAGVAKELRATLAQLSSKEIDGDKDTIIFGADIIVARLPAAVRNAPKPRKGNARPARR